jgi:hypothetical protein
MRVRFLAPLLVLAVAPQGLAAADELAPSQNWSVDQARIERQPAKRQEIAQRARKLAPPSATGDLGDVRFPEPPSPVHGARPPRESDAGPASRKSVEPQGGGSLDLKWHATNDRVDPFDAVRHSSGPDGGETALKAASNLDFDGSAG